MSETDEIRQAEETARWEVLTEERAVSAQGRQTVGVPITGLEIARRASENVAGFWDDNKADATEEARSLTREEAQALGYTLSPKFDACDIAQNRKRAKRRKWGWFGGKFEGY